MRLRHTWYLFAAISALVLTAEMSFAQQAAPTTTDQANPIDPAKPSEQVKPAAPAVDPNAEEMDGDGSVSLGDIPDVETEELTADLAHKALDGYVLVQNKYQDSPLEDYADLQTFVDKDPKGPELEKDIKALGFKSVTEWNVAVTSVSVAYNNILDDQTTDLKQQIEDVKASKDMAQDMKDRTIKSLQNSIPSENNTKIVQDLMKDKDYADKVKLLESTDE
jgi:hypothetical protein